MVNDVIIYIFHANGFLLKQSKIPHSSHFIFVFQHLKGQFDISGKYAYFACLFLYFFPFISVTRLILLSCLLS